MALNPTYSDVCANLQANAIGDSLNTGYIRIYSGVQPDTADTALSGQVLLAELRFAADAFAAAVAGVITANAITSDSSANADGTATWARILQSNGTTVMFDGSVGLADAEVIINAVEIVTGAVVSCSGITLTISKG